MPEGPSIVILKELVSPFKGATVRHVEGNSKTEIQRALKHKVLDFRSWGKHFLICFSDFTVRIHFMLFGSYTINERKEAVPRLRLIFSEGELNFYACSVKIIEGDLDAIYDWSADIMSEKWNPRAANKKLRQAPETLACDAILDQHIFSGAGNIFKNEVLWRTRIHPLSKVGALSPVKRRQLVQEVHRYAYDFLKWKKQFVLRKNWQAHAKKICPRCQIPFVKAHLGRTNRRSFYCTRCQVLYDEDTTAGNLPAH